MLNKFAKWTFAVTIAIALAVFGSTAAAQAVSGSISGTVTDTSGAVVQGATVTITNTDRGDDVRVLTTGASGLFHRTISPAGHLQSVGVGYGLQDGSRYRPGSCTRTTLSP